MSSSLLNQNRFIVNQVLDNLFNAITEHRWKDALALLPAVSAFGKSRVSPYFLWKVIHITMESTHIPFGIQMNIFNVILKSSIKNYIPVLDMMSSHFGKLEDKDFEVLFEGMNETSKHKIANQKLRILCNSYYALHHYLIWKNASLAAETPLSESKRVEEDCTKDVELLRSKAYNLLKKAYLLSQFSERQQEKDNKETGEEINSEDSKILCEWLLGPLLDVQQNLMNENMLERSTNRKSYNINTFHGLDLIEKYASSHSSNLPTLRTYYFYLAKHHLEEKTLILNILQKIVDLSPESSLTLQYVHTILSKQLGENFRGNKSKRDTEVCLLANVDIEELMKCLDLLSSFIEFQMWRKDIRAWKTLVDIMKVFHRSWVSCWNCDDCIISREKIAAFSDRLNDWPDFVWHNDWLSSLSKDDVEILVYSGYSSYILGFSDQISKHSVKRLEELECNREGMKLVILMKQNGDYNKDLLLYLGRQRKQRWYNRAKKLPRKRVITKKNIKFGTYVEDSDPEEFEEENYSTTSSISNSTASIIPTSEKNLIENDDITSNVLGSGENDRITSHVLSRSENVGFGKRKRVDDSTSRDNEDSSNLDAVCENTDDASNQEKNGENTRNKSSNQGPVSKQLSYYEKSPNKKRRKLDIDTNSTQNIKEKEIIQNKTVGTLNATFNVNKTNLESNCNDNLESQDFFNTLEAIDEEDEEQQQPSSLENRISTSKVFFGKKGNLNFKSPIKPVKKGTCNKDVDYYDWF